MRLQLTKWLISGFIAVIAVAAFRGSTPQLWAESWPPMLGPWREGPILVDWHNQGRRAREWVDRAHMVLGCLPSEVVCCDPCGSCDCQAGSQCPPNAIDRSRCTR